MVGAWAAANLGLALIMLAFPLQPVELSVHVAAAAIVAGFGITVLLAMRAGRVGTQQRQPRTARAAVFAGLGVAMGLTGLAYGWWLSVLGAYPLALAAWLVRGERLPRGARPWPVVQDGAQPANPASLVYHGSSLGAAVALPTEHPAHGAPPTPSSPPDRSRLPAAQPSDNLVRAVLLVALVSAARSVVNVLRGRRR
ncbi:MAG: hypothetical protein DLM62_07850 [Pseudonocardiales bacterium]|nr:MAG: hypothetical protein DLM62_07850 [Pseudonocardiales bacterium]